MSREIESVDLNGRLLVAMPGMGDPRFDQSVIFICSHSEGGAMGLIINKPLQDLHLSDILDQLEIQAGDGARKMSVFIGGPVEKGRGFVLHSGDYEGDAATLKVTPDFSMTATRDILEDISHGRGPRLCLMAMGYSGWGPGQLEEEIQRNGWLICEASQPLVFDAAPQSKWQGALSAMGIDPLHLSSEGGYA